MRFYGRNKYERAANTLVWETWCQQTRRRPQLRQFAEKFTELIENQISSSRHMTMLAPQALKEAGGDDLTKEQLREVFLKLCYIWSYGLSLSNWAYKAGWLKNGD